MSNSIDYQLSVAYQINERQINEQQKAQKWAETRIAQSHHSTKKLAVGKDIVLPSNPEGKKSVKGKGAKGSQKPSLPTPSKNSWDGLGEGQNIPLIAIIGKVLALQAKTNSNFWSSLWKSGTQSMKIQVSFAPIIGKAVEGQWSQQAKATEAEAKMAYKDAWINLGMFVGAVAIGAAMGYSGEDAAVDDPETPPAFKTEDSENTSTNSVDDDSESEEEATNSTQMRQSETTTMEEGEQTANQTTANSNAAQSNEEDSVRANNRVEKGGREQRARRTKENTQSRFGRGMKSTAKFLQRTMMASGFTDLGARVGTGFNDANYKGKQAEHTKEAGQHAATSQVSEQYAQYYGQNFNRTEEIRQGAQQNIDYAMNILKSVVDQITSTVASMFRG